MQIENTRFTAPWPFFRLRAEGSVSETKDWEFLHLGGLSPGLPGHAHHLAGEYGSGGGGQWFGRPQLGGTARGRPLCERLSHDLSGVPLRQLDGKLVDVDVGESTLKLPGFRLRRRRPVGVPRVREAILAVANDPNVDSTLVMLSPLALIPP